VLNDQTTSIHSGVDDLIDEALASTGKGTRPGYASKKCAKQLSGAGPTQFDGIAFVRGLYRRVEANGKASKRQPSAENWRFIKKLDISDDNRSQEKTLEKTIARVAGENWVNQVPTSSGLVTSGERQRNIDLVHRLGDGAFDFIELKVGSDTPLFAALEILKNGLVYVYSRRSRDELEYSKAKSPLLWAEQVTLVVLASTPYYASYDFGWLDSALRQGLSALIEEQLDDRLRIDFRFERFPDDFTWKCDDDALLGALARRCPPAW